MPAVRAAERRVTRRAEAVLRRWLVFVHQLPAHPSNARVKTWRRLQQIGAVAVKNAVHVLPNNPQSLEDFEWLRTEVVSLGGEATIFEANTIRGIDERKLTRQLSKTPAGDGRIGQGGRQEKSGSGGSQRDLREYQHRTWVTRPRPGVDRFSSAWFIRRFVDPQATFIFAESPAKHPDAVPYDMYQTVGFRHEGDRCTFEVLREHFGVEEPAVRQIAEIVHDLDLKDDRFNHAHAPTVGALVEGLRASFAQDGELLEHGIAMFEALYQSFRRVKGRTKDIC